MILDRLDLRTPVTDTLLEYIYTWQNKRVSNPLTGNIVKVGSLPPKMQDRYRPHRVDNMNTRPDQTWTEHKFTTNVWISVPKDYKFVSQYLEDNNWLILCTTDSTLVNTLFDKDKYIVMVSNVPLVSLVYMTIIDQDTELDDVVFKEVPEDREEDEIRADITYHEYNTFITNLKPFIKNVSFHNDSITTESILDKLALRTSIDTSIISEMFNSKRVGIPYLHSTNHSNTLEECDVMDILNAIRSNNNTLDSTIAKITEKVDGFRFSFGIDDLGDFFVESAYSGIIKTDNGFSDWSISNGRQPSTYNKIFDDVYRKLKNDVSFMNILKAYAGTTDAKGIKVLGELMHTGSGTSQGNRLSFVKTQYDMSKLGSYATVAIFKIVDSKGDDVSGYTNELIRELCTNYSSDIKFQYVQIPMTVHVPHGVSDANGLQYAIQQHIPPSFFGEKPEGIVVQIGNKSFKVIMTHEI